MNTLDQAGGGRLVLATACAYVTKPAAAGNAVSKITTAITVVGNQSTLTRDSGDPFRFFEVASGGDLTLLHLVMKGGCQSAGGALSIDQGATAALRSVVGLGDVPVRLGRACFRRAHRRRRRVLSHVPESRSAISSG